MDIVARNDFDPNRNVKVFVHFTDESYAKVNFNLAAIKHTTQFYAKSSTLVAKKDAVKNLALESGTSISKAIQEGTELHNSLTEAFKTMEIYELRATKIKESFPEVKKVKIEIYNVASSRPNNSYSFFPSEKVLKALESMAELTLHVDYAREVNDNKTTLKG